MSLDMTQSVDAQTPTETRGAMTLAPTDPAQRDRDMLDAILELGRDDGYKTAGRWAQIFLTHAVVTGLAFCVAGVIYS